MALTPAHTHTHTSTTHCLFQRRAAKGQDGASGDAAPAQAPSAAGDAPSQPAQGASAAGAAQAREVRHYGQRRAKLDPVDDAGAPQMADDVLSLLAAGSRRRAA